MNASDRPSYDPAGFDRLAAVEEQLFWFTARRSLICWALQRHFPDMRTFCEIGCGNGATLAAIASTFPAAQLTAIDFYTEGLELTRQRVPSATVLAGDVHALPDLVPPVDVIGAFDVLEHLDDDAGALCRIRDTLRPGGGVILTVPQHPALWSVADEIGYHRRRYERSPLIGLVQKAGLTPIMVTSFVSLLLPALWISRRRASKREDAFAELQIGPGLNKVCTAVMKLERGLIKAGLRLPAGGSLLLLARRG